MSTPPTSANEIDLDLILGRLLPAKLIKIFQNCADTPTAARLAAEQLEKLQDQLALDRHQEYLDSLSEPLDIARYYGRLYLPRRDLRLALGNRELKREEFQAYQEGRRDRMAEMRALELHRAQRGHRVEPWMTQ